MTLNFTAQTSPPEPRTRSTLTMAEKNALHDPHAAIQVAIGDPFPELVPQKRGDTLELDRVYFSEPKRYIVKRAKLSRDDVRCFDTEGRLICNSHHPGKNPYDQLDPLGLTNQGNRYAVAGGEWESICDVTTHGHGFRSYKIRPKTMTMHGRQYVKRGDTIVMNVGKKGKLSTMSIRDTFEICPGDDGDEVYLVYADLMGRTFRFENSRGELVAVMAKTNKALVLEAAFGAGSESTVDVAAGVDCSVILAGVFGIMQVGSSIIGDVASNYLFDPLKDSVVDSAVDASGAGGLVNSYTQASNSAVSNLNWGKNTYNFLKNNVFK